MNNAVRINYDKHTAEILCADTETGDFTPVTIDLDKLRIVDAATNASWWITRTSQTNPGKYAQCRDKRTGKIIYMHRLLCPTAKVGLEIMHLNHKSLDNRRVNLLPVDVKTHRLIDAVSHDRPHKKNKLGVKGVRETRAGVFVAYHNRTILGRFDNLEAATIVSKQYREWLYAQRKEQLLSAPALLAA